MTLEAGDSVVADHTRREDYPVTLQRHSEVADLTQGERPPDPPKDSPGHSEVADLTRREDYPVTLLYTGSDISQRRK